MKGYGAKKITLWLNSLVYYCSQFIPLFENNYALDVKYQYFFFADWKYVLILILSRNINVLSLIMTVNTIFYFQIGKFKLVKQFFETEKFFAW